ncbi:waprin-Phi1-like [Podarcis raffonei]|uniref:waprin-Phi1-like n=1 Tax=Podarcis raffonei TaxID=65483 RepID=UPI0023294902|nr:waprin-Phi1-like [Podarcis raffonei]
MKTRNSSCFHHLLLVSLVGLLTASAHLTDTPGQNVTVAAEKAGTCPNATLMTARGNCTEECQSDASCAGTEKCCWTGCGASCRLPNDKPGFCPPDPPIISLLGICRDQCREDSDCPSNRKCCMSGCNKWNCVPPREQDPEAESPWNT